MQWWGAHQLTSSNEDCGACEGYFSGLFLRKALFCEY